MNKNELKKILKPLIKQCIKEVIFEEGVLSSIISEVVQGVSGQPILERETVKVSSEKQPNRDQDKNLQEIRSKMLKAVALDGYNGVNVFEGTEPLRSGGRAGAAPNPTSPLSNYAPGDAGIDISGIMKVAGGNWSKMI